MTSRSTKKMTSRTGMILSSLQNPVTAAAAAAAAAVVVVKAVTARMKGNKVGVTSLMSHCCIV